MIALNLSNPIQRPQCRVDMIGENGTVWLLLVENPKESELTWHIAIRTVRKKYCPLTDESFADALKWVMQK